MGLISNIYKQFVQLNIKKQTAQSKNGQKTSLDIFPKMYIWLTGTWEDAQHHKSLEKCKSKTQWNITSHLSECLSSKSLQITNAGKDMEKREPLYTIGRNVNWCRHYGKQYGGFSKQLKIELPYNQAIPLLGVYTETMVTLIWKDTCTSMFTAVLFAIAKKWQ